jgi:hypothetical protein
VGAGWQELSAASPERWEETTTSTTTNGGGPAPMAPIDRSFIVDGLLLLTADCCHCERALSRRRALKARDAPPYNTALHPRLARTLL